MHVASPAGASRGGGGGVGRIQRGCLTTSSHTHASTPVEAEQAERRPRKHEKHHAGRDAIKWNKINAPTHSAGIVSTQRQGCLVPRRQGVKLTDRESW